MSSVYGDFQRELQGWRRQYSGRPKDELSHLLLLALEREQIVTVAYREAMISTRVQAMPVSHEVRALLSSALLWIWRDEEMHSTYVRGVLLRLGSGRLQLQALAEQVAGSVAGWATAVRHHLTWTEAPASRALAALFVAAGWAAGRVPAAVWQHLRHGNFVEYCRFNIEAEETARLCWERMVELAGEVRPELVEDFDRMAADEERHAQVFRRLMESFDDRDRPRIGADELRAGLAAVSPYFVSRRREPQTVHVVEGGDKLAALFHVLQEMGIEKRLQSRPRVIIKPTFMMAYHRRDSSVYTDVEMVEALAEWLMQHGAGEVRVGEAPNLYDLWYGNRTVENVAGYVRYRSPVIDLSAERISHEYARGVGQSTVAKAWAEADLRILFGKLRAHPVDQVSFTLGAAEGIGTPCHDKVFLDKMADRHTAAVMALDDFPPDFALLEGWDAAPDTLMGVIACPDPLQPRRLYAGRDALAVDLVAARHVGLSHWSRSPLLRMACHWFGAPEVRVVGCDTPVAGWRGPYQNEWTSLLSLLAQPVYTLASKRGAVFVPQMDVEAFPPLRAESTLLRWRRASLRRLLGYRLAP
ncbi:MAG TPA: DUF362 domain-containing protein [Candidatus Xenobia bacterium]|jgi:uncharacterized protein (DUF362 family)